MFADHQMRFANCSCRVNASSTRPILVYCLFTIAACLANDEFALAETDFIAAPPITALAFAPDGNSVVIGSQAGLEFRSWPALQHTRESPTQLTHIHDLAFSPDGRILAAVGGDPAQLGVVELFHWPELGQWRRLIPHDDLIYAVAWAADSLHFVTASADQRVGLHQLAADSEPEFLEDHSRGVLAAAYLPDQQGLLTAGIDATIRCWDLNSGSTLRTLANHTQTVHDLAVRPGAADGTPPMVASASDDRTVRLWQPTIGRLVRFIRLDSEPLSIAWTTSGDLLLAACKDGHLRVIDPETVELVDDLPAFEGVAYALAVAADESVLVGGERGQLRRVDVGRKAR